MYVKSTATVTAGGNTSFTNNVANVRQGWGGRGRGGHSGVHTPLTDERRALAGRARGC